MERFLFPSSTCGIYHLMQGERVMYVGQSNGVLSRVGNWAGTFPGKFDSWTFFPCDESELNRLEREHIERYQPPMNVAGMTRAFINATRNPKPPGARIEWQRRRIAKMGETLRGTDVRSLGLPFNNQQLLSLPGFPDPVYLRQSKNSMGRCHVARWNREAVLAWLEQYHDPRDEVAA